MFDWLLDPKMRLAALCFVTALCYWNNDVVFLLFSTLALFSRFSAEEV